MSFENGILNLTNWTGNVIMPALSGLFFAIGLMRLAGAGQHQRWMWAAFLSLMVSGILRGLETFASQSVWDDPDLYWIALMNLVNWVCNVIMPLYGTLQIGAGILQYSGIGHRMYGGSNWMRHFLVAAGCFMLSGIVRLSEWFIQQGVAGIR
jgi:hypothetical protein